MRSKNVVILVVLFVMLALGCFFYFTFFYLRPDSFGTYYKIFDKNEILNGDEVTAEDVDQKLDQRLAKYRRAFEKIAGTKDQKKLRALFYMNFVHYYGFYGERTLNESTLKDVLFGSEYFHCGTNTKLMAMLFDRAGIAYRTVSINNGTHGFVEVKFSDDWNLLDPTVNLWFDKSTEEIIAGEPFQVKKFLMKAEDMENAKAREHLDNKKIECSQLCLKDQMLSMGKEFKAKIDKYNYIDLTGYTY